jgi:predicted component of type VI protein secretion system
MPQPGESFEHLVQIVDRGLSVSKTHVEFGEHDGGLWVADRFSSNGTVVRRPGEDGLRCEPGRRVLVPRGSRVEIGEQAFTVA